jgi:hypothetical protein
MTRGSTLKTRGVAQRVLAADLDAIVGLALDDRGATRLRRVRQAALARLRTSGFVPAVHWMDWAPVALVMVLAVATSWTPLIDTGQSIDADLLADTLPVDAYLDADFRWQAAEEPVELIEN